MEFNAVIDISSIIWNEADYTGNKHSYFNLLSGISTLLLKMENEKPIILLRDELLLEMTNSFPANKIPNDFWGVVKQVYSFLGKIESNIRSYPDNVTPDLVSIPNQVKAHYNNTAKSEINYLISKIHSDNESQNVYFTFEYLWGGNYKLKTVVGEDSKEYETIISDKGNDLEIFFTKFKPKFEHNPKHDKTRYNTREKWEEAEDKDGFISRLSCYNGDDTIEPQRILNKRYSKKFGIFFYSYDTVNEVYVVYRWTRSNIYHGYDENNPNRIPKEVRKRFNK